MAVGSQSVEKLVEDLSVNLDDLETSLTPLLNQALSTTTSRLPLLDKAKICILAAYAIESLLFSYLRLNGVDAKEHAVFKELTRVKAYFEKVKQAELGPSTRPTTLDKAAASRFVKHGLAGNERFDKQRAATKRTAADWHSTAQWGSANRFEGAAKRLRTQDELVPVVRAAEIEESDDTKARAGRRAESGDTERRTTKRQRRQEAALAKQSPASDRHGQDSSIPQSTEASTPTTLDPDEGRHALAKDGAVEAISHKIHRKKKRKSRGEVRQELENKHANEMA